MQHLDIRYTLDVMHCERNFAENLLHTICVMTSKDDVSVRKDMERLGIRQHMWMTPNPSRHERMLKPASNYVLTPDEFDIFCTRLENLKVPIGYSSEIRKHIREKKFGALKSHNYHVLMQTLIPLALRGLMEKTTRSAIMQSYRVFKRLCCRTWDPAIANDLKEDVAETMSLMQITFPPSFFVIMSHLPLDLVEELIILEPVHVR